MRVVRSHRKSHQRKPWRRRTASQSRAACRAGLEYENTSSGIIYNFNTIKRQGRNKQNFQKPIKRVFRVFRGYKKRSWKVLEGQRDTPPAPQARKKQEWLLAKWLNLQKPKNWYFRVEKIGKSEKWFYRHGRKQTKRMNAEGTPKKTGKRHRGKNGGADTLPY